MKKLFITEEIIRTKMCVSKDFKFNFRFDYGELIIEIPTGNSFLMYYSFDKIISYFRADNYGIILRFGLSDLRELLKWV